MPDPTRPAPTGAALLALHLKRAFAWNLSAVAVTAAEGEALAAAGVTDPAVQRYAVWRRSALAAAVLPTTVVAVLAVANTLDDGFDGYRPLGVAADLLWLATVVALPLVAAFGSATWRRPHASHNLLAATWAAAFLTPFLIALIPLSAAYHLAPQSHGTPSEELLLTWLLAMPGYAAMLPAVVSLIPGLVNGCLRAKTLLPAAALPGWLLVTAAPGTLLFWLVVLVPINHLVTSPLLVAGMLLWAGAPLGYALAAGAFVRPHPTADGVRRVAGVKRLVTLTTATGIGLLAAFALTAKVADLQVIGFDRSAAVSTHFEELTDGDEEITLEDAVESLAESKSLVWAFDGSVFQVAIDFLAKLLVVTVVFTDLAVRATAAAWRHERAFRGVGSAGEAERDVALTAVAAACSDTAGDKPQSGDRQCV